MSDIQWVRAINQIILMCIFPYNQFVVVVLQWYHIWIYSSTKLSLPFFRTLRIWWSKKFVQLIRKKIWEQQLSYLLNVFALTNDHTNLSITSTFYYLKKTRIRMKTLQTVIHGHDRFIIGLKIPDHEENSSHLRTDDNCWVQYLENMRDDSIRWSLCTE